MKCETEGIYVHNETTRGGRVANPQQDANLRTDQMFRDREDIMHHTGTSILERLPFLDMLDNFPIDPMHLVYGVVRTILNTWTEKRRSMKVKVSLQQMNEISSVVVVLGKSIPDDFIRKTRTLDELSRHSRLLLLYVLSVVLKNRISNIVYQHFMLLHVAIRILSCKVSVSISSYIDYANALLGTFLLQAPYIYGDQFITYNVHNLIHLADESRRLGPLEQFSCFLFENHLGKLKNLVRKSNKPLQQLVNRIIERSKQPATVVQLNPMNKGTTFKLFGAHHEGPMITGLNGDQFNRCLLRNFCLAINVPNPCCVITDSNDVILIENFVQEFDGKTVVIGKKYLICENFFDLNGLDSLPLGIQVCCCLAANVECWPLEKISFKAIKLSIKEENSQIYESLVTMNLMNYDIN